ncbi:hypothetical protein HG536_0A01460 [Torulaspora globosa]|uniref:FMR1-interacting protein 1 conserved domain-containing protein n=1 Tax=Torulaspora globosa TaxID=48254 RepID=A0A7G3Z9Z3_9SACH|nr:uncharacterized protein HG536_0A01460 [Torulaspora globosa]QLL30329.1 hypothetical protein HG536_0A01460 [Torulaspora globosa]
MLIKRLPSEGGSIAMNYHSNAGYGRGFRPLPRPSSSGTLSGGPQYEPTNKRQRLQETPAVGAGYPPPPLPYHMPTPMATYPYCMQPPPASHPMPLPYMSNEWSAQPYREPPQTIAGSRQQPQSVEIEAASGDEEGDERGNDESSQDESSEEQQSEATGSQPLTVPGTSITLATEEDILKWREERKRMWLLKISNNKQKHMQGMGIKEEDLKVQKSALQEGKKQKQFIQNIQNQVNRINPRSTLSVRIAQREMAQENSRLLDFIEKLGDAGLLNCELTEEEKEKLFGPHDSTQKKGRNSYRSDFKKSDTHTSNKAYHRR